MRKKMLLVWMAVMVGGVVVGVAAAPLVKLELDLGELDGTNGVGLYHSVDRVFGPMDVAVWKGEGRVTLGLYYASVHLNKIHTKLFGWHQVDGMNGTRHDLINARSQRLSKPVEGGYKLVGTSYLDEFSVGAVHFVRVTNCCDYASVDISGDVNSDGINDIIFSSQWLDVATDYGEVVYGGKSPSAPPQIRRPQWINVGRAGTQLVE